MGINAGNIVVTREKTVVQNKEPQSMPSDPNITEPSIVVDGKVKKISKKSAFLLDMLSLDDEHK
jgi:hypothetical protein